MLNIASHLSAMAKERPHQKAVVFPAGRDAEGRVSYTHYTFDQLDDMSSQIAAGLGTLGIGGGARVALMVPPSLDFFALTFAIFKMGAIPVMIDPGIGIKSLKTCLAEAEPEAFIGIPKAHIARILFGWAKKSIKTLVTVGKRPIFSGYTLKDVEKAGEGSNFETMMCKPDRTAAILFTSGSTGIPKGAIYTYQTFETQVQKLKEMYGIKPGEIDLPTFPLFALFAAALGMTAIIPDMDATRPGSVDPDKIFEAIENFGITNMFGSPALINRVSRATNAPKLPTLKRVISAGAPVPAATLERFSRLLNDDCEIHTPYGATESLPVASIGSKEILNETAEFTGQGKGICVGKPVSGLDLEIIPITDDPIESWSDELHQPIGTIGEIVVRGPQVTAAYFKREESTRLAKIPDNGNDRFYHRMGDLGYLDKQGRIWFCGRKAHRLETSDGPLYTIPVEGIFNTHEKVFRTALVGIGKFGQQKPAICVELEEEFKAANSKEIIPELKEIGSQFELTQGIDTFLIHPSFPVDIRHNAKIFREKLAVWAEKELG